MAHSHHDLMQEMEHDLKTQEFIDNHGRGDKTFTVNYKLPKIQPQIDGSHYQDMKIQPWEYFTANATKDEISGACKQNILKYMRDKNDKLSDLKKARWYLNEWIKLEGGE